MIIDLGWSWVIDSIKFWLRRESVLGRLETLGKILVYWSSRGKLSSNMMTLMCYIFGDGKLLELRRGGLVIDTQSSTSTTPSNDDQGGDTSSSTPPPPPSPHDPQHISLQRAYQPPPNLNLKVVDHRSCL